MLEQFFSQPAPKVYWWRSRAFRIGLAVFVALMVIAVVLFNQQIGNLLKSFGIKAATERTITLNGETTGNTYFLDGDYYTTPASSFKVESGKLMLDPPIAP